MNFFRGARAVVGCAAFLALGAMSFMQADDEHRGPESDQPIKLAPGARLGRISGSEAARKRAGQSAGASGRSSIRSPMR